jgi:hypothetical protein
MSIARVADNGIIIDQRFIGQIELGEYLQAKFHYIYNPSFKEGELNLDSVVHLLNTMNEDHAKDIERYFRTYYI